MFVFSALAVLHVARIMFDLFWPSGSCWRGAHG